MALAAKTNRMIRAYPDETARILAFPPRRARRRAAGASGRLARRTGGAAAGPDHGMWRQSVLNRTRIARPFHSE
jgi:hypothetical protein